MSDRVKREVFIGFIATRKVSPRFIALSKLNILSDNKSLSDNLRGLSYITNKSYIEIERYF